MHCPLVQKPMWYSWPPITVAMYHLSHNTNAILSFKKHNSQFNCYVNGKWLNFDNNRFIEYVVKNFGPCLDISAIAYPGWIVNKNIAHDETIIIDNGIVHNTKPIFTFYEWDKIRMVDEKFGTYDYGLR